MFKSAKSSGRIYVSPHTQAICPLSLRSRPSYVPIHCTNHLLCNAPLQLNNIVKIFLEVSMFKYATTHPQLGIFLIKKDIFFSRLSLDTPWLISKLFLAIRGVGRRAPVFCEFTMRDHCNKIQNPQLTIHHEGSLSQGITAPPLLQTSKFQTIINYTAWPLLVLGGLIWYLQPFPDRQKPPAYRRNTQHLHRIIQLFH